jgi:hypothetical protein
MVAAAGSEASVAVGVGAGAGWCGRVTTRVQVRPWVRREREREQDARVVWWV